MKKSVVLLLFMVLSAMSAIAQQADFDQANTYFENGELSEAMTMYHLIEESGYVSGGLFLNMGIAAIQLDSMGLAKYYFLKAQQFETTEEQAETGLEYVNSQFSRNSATLPKLPWDRAIDWINDEVTASGLFIIGFLITISGLILLYLGWMSIVSLEKSFPYLLSLIITGTAVAGISFYADYVNQRYDEAVVISGSKRVMEQPQANSTLISIAYEGYDLTVDHWKSNEKDGWLYIRLGNGQYGWVPHNEIKIL